MRSVMHHRFSRVPTANIPRSVFDRSCGYKTTFNAGYLVPVFYDQAYPGDTFNLKMTSFARLATPIVPFMDNLFLDTFFFAVPNRLIWDNWERFNGEQDNPGDSTDFLVPQIVAPEGTGFEIGSLSDYLTLPVQKPGISVSAFWHRAFNLIYNEWFRDENLQNSAVIHKGDGPDPVSDYPMRRRGKRFDYFTSCLPWPQKGPSVPLPLVGNAPVIGDGKTLGLTDGDYNYGLKLASHQVGLGANAGSFNTVLPSAVSDTVFPPITNLGVSTVNSGLIADLSAASASTINALRQAFQIQRLLERDARGGTRYIEQIKAHFNVHSDDARLQRPEYLGGSSAPIIVNPVTQTSSSDNVTPQGNLAGFGTVVDHRAGFVKSFTEHCLLLGIVSVRADLNYQQGVDRIFSYRTRWDFYWPALAHLGEQAVLNKEIYAQGPAVVDVNGNPVDDNVFGYQERFAEMRYKRSSITGKFRTIDPLSLDSWHLAQNFGNLPVLNSDFIVENPPMSRVLAVEGEPHFLFDSYFSIKCARPMPVYSVPGLIDHL